MVAVAATSGFFQISRNFMHNQALEIETTQAARATVDVIVRDLRLAGACLPVTGEFISLDGIDDNEEDEIIIRTGLTRPDLSCVRSATTIDMPIQSNTLLLDSVQGFISGMRAYIRAPNGTGEFFTISSVSSSANTLSTTSNLSGAYPATSGVYAVDERRYYINHWQAWWGEEVPELMMQVGSQTAQSFAVGIEKLDIQYQLRRDCPPCDVVEVPADENEWRLVEELLLTVTARSDRRNQLGNHYRRSLTVAAKPRNLLPQ